MSTSPVESRICIRYKTGNPCARPQSLAKTMELESNSHVGHELSQLPPPIRTSCPLSRLRSQRCRNRLSSDVNASHLRSGDPAEEVSTIGIGWSRSEEH